jgi:hypothetical protein
MKMQLLPVLFFFYTSTYGQFFAKVDEDFKFNGIYLRSESGMNEKHTKDCKLIEETESYRVWQPKDNTVKFKRLPFLQGFTLHDILYITDFENNIFQIRAVNWDPKEHEKILADMRKKARRSGTIGKELSGHYFFKQENRTTTYYKRTTGNDTLVIFITLDYFNSRNEDYRKHHPFFSFINTNIKSKETREFLTAYAPPESTGGFTTSNGTSRYLMHYGYGMEAYIRNDTLNQVTVFNKDDKYNRFSGTLPYDLSMDDLRKNIRSKLGEPDSKNRDGSAWYYTKGDKQVHIQFVLSSNKTEADDNDVLRSVLVAQKSKR